MSDISQQISAVMSFCAEEGGGKGPKSREEKRRADTKMFTQLSQDQQTCEPDRERVPRKKCAKDLDRTRAKPASAKNTNAWMYVSSFLPVVTLGAV